MIEKAKEIILGIELVARCLGVREKYLAIEDNKPEAVKQFKLQSPQLSVKVLPAQYPQGGEKQLIKNLLGKEVPSGKLPFEVGVVVHNIATIFAIYEAVYLGKPLYERVVTVSGGLLANPKNLLVRLGTPIKELINFCAPLSQEPGKVIIGGPMMGIAQFSDEVPIIKSSGGVLLFNKQEARVLEEEFCIRCAACVRECPVGLMPCLINLASEKALWEQAKSYGAGDCIECGLCSYVCPANRRLVQSIKRAKLEIAR
jgi:electron transport complex protein RnfC